MRFWGVKQKNIQKNKFTAIAFADFANFNSYLLILAVSKPVIKTSKFLFKSGGGTTSVVLILDNSFSMQYEVEKGRTAFGIAKEIAQNVILNLKSGDSASLILTNDTNSVNSGSPSYDLSAITENIKQANASNLVADMQKSVADALTSLEKSTEYNQEIYIVADTQKISFKNLLVDKLKLSKKRKNHIFYSKCSAENAVNTAVLQVRPQNYACIAPGNISITVQVRNFSSIPQVKSISLFLDGEKKTSKFLNLEFNGNC